MEKAARAAEIEEMKVHGRSSSTTSTTTSDVEESEDRTTVATGMATSDGTSSDASSTATVVSTKIAPIRGLVMVVGRGKNSPTGASVLAPYIIRALANPTFFVPPLVARQIPNNPGRIILAKQDVSRYIKAQLKGKDKMNDHDHEK